MIKPGGLLHVAVVADILDCTPRHVRNLIQRQELEAVRIGRRNFRIIRASLLKFMADKKNNGSAEGL